EPDHLQAARHPMMGLEETNAQAPTSRQNLSGNSPHPKGPLPLNFLTGDFVHSDRPMTFRMELPPERYRFTFLFADESGHPQEHGPFNLKDGESIGGHTRFRDVHVTVGEPVVKQVDRNIR